MTAQYRNLHAAQDAVKAARLLGYDCRNIIIQQPRGESAVRICQGGASILWAGGFHYIGRPTRALAYVAFEFCQLAKAA